jgi:hypothetical protein
MAHMGQDIQQVLGEITTSKYEEQYPEFFEDFRHDEMPIPPDYEETPADKDFFIPEYGVSDLLAVDANGKEDRVKDEKKKIKESEEVNRY